MNRSHKGALAGKTILVAEDEAEIRSAIQEILEGEGAIVVAVSNGISGLRELTTHKFDLVISDVRMPDGDGISMARKMREVLAAPPPILFVTAFYDQSLNEALGEGAAAVLKKPFGMAELVENAEQILRSHEEVLAENRS